MGPGLPEFVDAPIVVAGRVEAHPVHHQRIQHFQVFVQAGLRVTRLVDILVAPPELAGDVAAWQFEPSDPPVDDRSDLGLVPDAIEPPATPSTSQLTTPLLLLVLNCCVGLKVSVAERGLIESPAAEVPVPLKLIVCGLPEALSLIETVPLRAPIAAGVKTTVIRQLALGASEVGHELD